MSKSEWIEAFPSVTGAPHRWVLYHGTSTLRWKCIEHRDRLSPLSAGSGVVSLTTVQSVAEYFACDAANADAKEFPDQEPKGVVLKLDGENLLHERYSLGCYVPDPDDIRAGAKWDPENVDLENVIFSKKDITPLSEFLIDTIVLKKATYDRYLAQGRRAFMPVVPFTAHLEMETMQAIIHHWGEEAFPGELDAVTLAISGMRRALARLRPSTELIGQKGGCDV